MTKKIKDKFKKRTSQLTKKLDKKLDKKLTKKFTKKLTRKLTKKLTRNYNGGNNNEAINNKVLNDIMNIISTYKISNYIDMIKKIVTGENVQISLWFFIKNIFKYRSIKNEFEKILGYINSFDYIKIYQIIEQIIAKIKQIEDNKDYNKLYNLYLASIALILYIFNDKNILIQIEKTDPVLLKDINYFRTLTNDEILNDFILELKEKKEIESKLDTLIANIYKKIIEYIKYEINQLSIKYILEYYKKTFNISINLNDDNFTILFEILFTISQEQFIILKTYLDMFKQQLLKSISSNPILIKLLENLLDKNNNDKQFELLNKIRNIIKNSVDKCSNNDECLTYIKTAESFEALLYLMLIIILTYYYKKHSHMFIIQGGNIRKNKSKTKTKTKKTL